jgi:hypothetical protein
VYPTDTTASWIDEVQWGFSAQAYRFHRRGSVTGGHRGHGTEAPNAVAESSTRRSSRGLAIARLPGELLRRQRARGGDVLAERQVVGAGDDLAVDVEDGADRAEGVEAVVLDDLVRLRLRGAGGEPRQQPGRPRARDDGAKSCPGLGERADERRAAWPRTRCNIM